MAGFMFLGMAYGIYMNASGFSFIFTGSLLQLSVASSVLYSPLIQKASALSWLLCSSLSSWISSWKKRIIHLHYLDLEFLFSVSLYSDRTLLWFRPWFDYRLIDIITQKAWYPESKKLLATSFRQMCFWKNEVAIKNTGGLLAWH